MERECDSLITELTQGKELARELLMNMHSYSREKCEFLVEKILSCQAKALSLLYRAEEDRQTHTISSNVNTVASEDCSQNVAVKKRKKLCSGKDKVKLCKKELLHDDGYRWRKYGQKDILGAKFPRCYFRCTHKKQGCLATKLVQKSDADPTMVEVTYQGSHTCNKVTNFNLRTASRTKVGLRQNGKHRQNPQTQIEETKQEPDAVSGTILQGLKVETENLTSRESFGFPSFDLHSPTYEEDRLFSETTLGGIFMGCFLPPKFMSPDSSASNGFPVSPFSVGDNGIGQSFRITSESDITEMVSTPTSDSNSTPFHFHFDNFDAKFPF